MLHCEFQMLRYTSLHCFITSLPPSGDLNIDSSLDATALQTCYSPILGILAPGLRNRDFLTSFCHFVIGLTVKTKPFILRFLDSSSHTIRMRTPNTLAKSYKERTIGHYSLGRAAATVAKSVTVPNRDERCRYHSAIQA